MKKLEYKPTDYPSDLTKRQWDEIKSFFPVGNKSGYHKRSLVEAVLYIVDNGCKWRALPKNYPPYGTVRSFYRRAKVSGLWDKIMRHLVGLTRVRAGKNENPGYSPIDSQSVKTSNAAENRGFDGGKKQKGTNAT